eukprot:scaffold161511_cov18-Tisochrysis_lutea.AAC.2
MDEHGMLNPMVSRQLSVMSHYRSVGERESAYVSVWLSGMLHSLQMRWARGIPMVLRKQLVMSH